MVDPVQPSFSPGFYVLNSEFFSQLCFPPPGCKDPLRKRACVWGLSLQRSNLMQKNCRRAPRANVFAPSARQHRWTPRNTYSTSLRSSAMSLRGGGSLGGRQSPMPGFEDPAGFSRCVTVCVRAACGGGSGVCVAATARWRALTGVARCGPAATRRAGRCGRKGRSPAPATSPRWCVPRVRPGHDRTRPVPAVRAAQPMGAALGSGRRPASAGACGAARPHARSGEILDARCLACRGTRTELLATNTWRWTCRLLATNTWRWTCPSCNVQQRPSCNNTSPCRRFRCRSRTLPSLVLSASVLWCRGMGVLTRESFFADGASPTGAIRSVRGTDATEAHAAVSNANNVGASIRPSRVRDF